MNIITSNPAKRKREKQQFCVGLKKKHGRANAQIDNIPKLIEENGRRGLFSQNKSSKIRHENRVGDSEFIKCREYRELISERKLIPPAQIPPRTAPERESCCAVAASRWLYISASTPLCSDEIAVKEVIFMAKKNINWKKKLEGREAGSFAETAAKQCRETAVREVKREEKAVEIAKKESTIAPEVLRRMVIMAMLIAMSVVIDRFLTIMTPTMKIGFMFVPAMVAGVLYGPFEGMVVYALADLIGSTLLAKGTPLIGLTFCYALSGIVYGLFLNERPFALFGSSFRRKKVRIIPDILIAAAIVCFVIDLFLKTAVLNKLNKDLTYWGLFVTRLLPEGIMFGIHLVLGSMVLELCKTLKKMIGEKTGKRKKAAKA